MFKRWRELGRRGHQGRDQPVTAPMADLLLQARCGVSADPAGRKNVAGILEAFAALRGNGVEVEPCGDDFERWRVGDFVLDDATLLRLAERMRLVEDSIAR